MAYTIIDRDTWPRREYFEHYLSAVPCTYSMTVKLDITHLRREGRKLYPTMLYLLTQAVNRWEQFRMALDGDGRLLLYSDMHPSYTVFHKGSGTFSNIWTRYSDDYSTFCRRYEEDLRAYGAIEKFTAKPGAPENTFNVSMIPWASFEGFNLNLAGPGYLLPIFTMGRFTEEGGKTLLPLALQVHHAVCDGFHACRFVNGLQEQASML